MIRPNRQRRFLSRLTLFPFYLELLLSVSISWRSSKQSTYCRFPFLAEAYVSLLRRASASPPVGTVAGHVDASVADDLFAAKDFFSRRCGHHSHIWPTIWPPHRVVYAPRSGVAAYFQAVLLFPTPRSLRMMARIFVSLCQVMFVAKKCRICPIR